MTIVILVAIVFSAKTVTKLELRFQIGNVSVMLLLLANTSVSITFWPALAGLSQVGRPHGT